MSEKLIYVELKSGYSDDGPAWIGRAEYSKSGRTIDFNGQAFQSAKGAGVGANYYDVESRDEYWISGVKKNESDRHWAGKGMVQIDEECVEAFLEFTGQERLRPLQYKVVRFSREDIRERIQEHLNRGW